jgi:dodecin
MVLQGPVSIAFGRNPAFARQRMDTHLAGRRGLPAGNMSACGNTPGAADRKCRDASAGPRSSMQSACTMIKENAMNEHVYKTIQITGTSAKNVDDAVRVAIAKASLSVHNLRWFKVTEIRGHVDGATVAHWQVSLDVGFTLD